MAVKYHREALREAIDPRQVQAMSAILSVRELCVTYPGATRCATSH